MADDPKHSEPHGIGDEAPRSPWLPRRPAATPHPPSGPPVLPTGSDDARPDAGPQDRPVGDRPDVERSDAVRPDVVRSAKDRPAEGAPPVGRPAERAAAGRAARWLPATVRDERASSAAAGHPDLTGPPTDAITTPAPPVAAAHEARGPSAWIPAARAPTGAASAPAEETPVASPAPALESTVPAASPPTAPAHADTPTSAPAPPAGPPATDAPPPPVARAVDPAPSAVDPDVPDNPWVAAGLDPRRPGALR